MKPCRLPPWCAVGAAPGFGVVALAVLVGMALGPGAPARLVNPGVINQAAPALVIGARLIPVIRGVQMTRATNRAVPKRVMAVGRAPVAATLRRNAAGG